MTGPEPLLDQLRTQEAKQARNTLAIQVFLSHVGCTPLSECPCHTLKTRWAGRSVNAALKTSSNSRTKTLK